MKYSSPETTTESKLAAAEQRIHRKPEIVGLQSYEYLLSNERDEFDRVISNPVLNPRLHYPLLTMPRLEEMARDTHLTLLELNSGPRNAKVDALYDSIEARYAELHLLELYTLLQNPDLPPAERREVIHWAREASETIFGKPQLDVFATVSDERMYDLLEQTFDDPLARQLQDELGALVGPRQPESQQRAELFEATDIPPHVAELIHRKFDWLVDHIDRDREYTADDMVEVFETALHKLDADTMGWRVEVIPGKATLSVSPHRKVVEVGEKRASLEGDEVQAKVVHEVGVHVWRSINAERSGWVSATYGQDGYLDFEESLANAFGSVYRKPQNAETGSLYRYIVAGYAYGMDGRGPRDFRDCYDIVRPAMLLGEINAGRTIDERILKRTIRNSYLQTHRMFRGTPGDLPGLLYLKDLAYVHGRKGVAKVMPLIACLADLDFLLGGKTDPTRRDHLHIAQDIVPHTPLGERLAA